MVANEGGLRVIPWQSSPLYVILLSSLVGVMGVALISPLLPELRTVFDVSDAQVGLVITVYTLPGAFLAPFVGLLADRFGRRNVIVPLLVLFGLSGTAIGFATTFTEVLLFRFLQGIGASALVTLAVTLIGDLYEGTQQNAVIGLNGSTIGVGAALYPVVGGALAAIRWNVPFLFFGVAVLVGLFAVVALRDLDAGRSSNVREYISAVGEVVAHPTALAIFAALFVIIFVFYGAVLTALPLLLSDEFGLASDRIGLLLAMNAVAVGVVSTLYSRIAERRTPPELVALGYVACGTSLIGIWLSPSPVFVGGTLLLYGTGLGIVIPSVDKMIVTLVSDRLRAGMMGLRTSFLRFGQTVGPAGFTVTAERAFVSTTAGYRLLLVVAGAAIIVAGGAAYLSLRR